MKPTPQPRVALVYDFDGTLIEKESVSPILKDLMLDEKEFWAECDRYAYKHDIDSVLAYMMLIFDKAEEKGLELSEDYLRHVGERLELREGLWGSCDWFDSVRHICAEKGIVDHHYIVTSGMVDILRGCHTLRAKTDKIFGSKIHRRKDGRLFPGRVVNYTNKTQYLYRISKGLLDERDEFAPNRKIDDRPIPFKHMVFIGDGYTDVPCFALMREYGGHAMAVLGSKKDNLGIIETLLADKRVDYISLQNHFTSDGILIKSFKKIIDKIRHDLNTGS